MKLPPFTGRPVPPTAESSTAASTSGLPVPADARTVDSAGTQPCTTRPNGLLNGLRRRLRPGALSVIAAPGYTATHIDPLPIPSDPLRKRARAAPKGASAATLQWTEQRAHSLAHKLHPPSSRADTLEPPPSMSAVANDLEFANLVQRLFTDGAPPPTPDPQVLELIETLITTGRRRSSQTPHVQYAGVLQCARALAAATRGNAAQAVAALGHLQHPFSLDPMPANANLDVEPSDSERHAWRAAQLLSHTASGFDTLIALRDDPTLDDSAPDSLMKRESLRTFLLAADHLAASAPEGATLPDSPSQQFQQTLRQVAGKPDPSNQHLTLARNALLCAAKVYAAPHATAQMIGDSAQVAAYVAWRSGFRESGNGSLLARTQGRLAKFITWIGRAEHRAIHRRAAFDPRRLLGMRKSPLTAMTYDAGGANLGLLSRETQALQDAVHAAIDAVSAHHAALLQRHADGTACVVLSREQRSVLLLREQCLAHWRRSARPLQKASAFKLSNDDRRAIADGLREAALLQNVDAGTALAHQELNRLKTLDLPTLARWADEAEALAPRPADAEDAAAQIRTARDLEQGRRIKPEGSTRAGFRKALSDVIDAAPVGNNVRYFDGGAYGVNTNPALNANDFSPGMATPGLSIGPGIRALRGRHAFVEIGSSSYGGEVFMGTDTRESTGAGLGVFAGFTFGQRSVHATAGAGVGAAYSHERSAPAGVIVRTQLRRDAAGKPTDSWRHHANDVVNFLFEQHALADAARPLAADQLWQRFSARFFRTPDISVNWRDQRRSSHAVSVNASLMARVAAGGVHVGPTLSASFDNLFAGKNERIDKNGWLRGTERSRARSSAVTLNASLVGTVSGVGHFSGHAAYPESISVGSIPIVGTAASLVPSGASVTLRMVDEHGRLNQKYIRRLIEFTDPVSFLSYLETRRANLARTARSEEKLDAFLDEVSASATRGNQAFGESAKLHPEISDVLNAYQAEIDLIRQCARSGLHGRDATQIELLESAMARLLNDPQSWKVSGYYTYEINSRGYAAGPSMLLQATAMTSTAGERVLAELAVSELEALDVPEHSGGGDGAH